MQDHKSWLSITSWWVVTTQKVLPIWSWSKRIPHFIVAKGASDKRARCLNIPEDREYRDRLPRPMVLSVTSCWSRDRLAMQQGSRSVNHCRTNHGLNVFKQRKSTNRSFLRRMLSLHQHTRAVAAGIQWTWDRIFSLFNLDHRLLKLCANGKNRGN